MPRRSQCVFGCPQFDVLHRFPKPEAYLGQFLKWKEIVGQMVEDKTNDDIYINYRICNHHFEEHFFYPQSKRLARIAYPTLKLGSFVSSSQYSHRPDSLAENFIKIPLMPQAQPGGSLSQVPDPNQVTKHKANKMPLRWGIVTAGNISHDFVTAFNSYPKQEDKIVAVAARNKDKAKEFAKLHNISTVFESYKALAASNVVDIVYIGALNTDHYELGKLFLESGKHVLCEKPLCMNYNQARSLVNISRNKKLFLMEAVWSRFAPSYIALEKDIKAGQLGDIKFVEVNFGVQAATVPRMTQKELGGSALLDLGIYVLQFAQFIFKEEPIKVTAVANLNEYEVDLNDTIILEYTGGRRAVLNIDAANKLWNKATVVGTAGRITLEDPFHFATEYVKVNGQIEKFPLHEGDKPYNYGNSSGLVYEAIETSRCIKAGLIESPRMSHNDSLILAKLEDTIRKQIGVFFDVDNKEYL